MKTVKFNISCVGLCADCDSAWLFKEEVPEDWNSMTDDEREEWAVGVFRETIQWGWVAEDES